MQRLLRTLWLVWLVLVVVGSVMPAKSTLIQLIGRAGVNDKVEHFTAYAALAGLPTLRQFGCKWFRMIVAVFLLGIALEFVQLLSPGRSCDWRDMVANSCGILVGVALARTVNRATR